MSPKGVAANRLGPGYFSQGGKSEFILPNRLPVPFLLCSSAAGVVGLGGLLEFDI